MREALKNLFSQQVVLENNERYAYTIKPFELTNALGKIVTTLSEYEFTREADAAEPFNGKLYRTKEGSWYEIDDVNVAAQKSTLRKLRNAIEAKENAELAD